jgi:UDP-glucose 4-epimerase
LIGVKLDLHIVDIKDYIKLKEVFEYYKNTNPINYIIHFAALKAVGESVSNPIKYYENNVNGTINLLKCAKEYKSTNFLFSSSATVYAPGEFVDEEAIF